jgi:hypothetical protein
MRTLVSVSEVPTFVLSGISKILGLPQMKLGWIAINGHDALWHQAREYLDLIADTYLSVSTPIQHATPRWLALRPMMQSQISNRIKVNYSFLHEQLENDTACRLLRVEGGWYAVLEVPNLLSEEELVLILLERDEVLVHPGYFFDFSHGGDARKGFLVLSLLPPPEIFHEGIGRLLARIRSAELAATKHT